MPSKDEDFLSHLKGRSREPFSDSADKQGRYSRAAGDLKAVRDIKSIEDRARDIRERMRGHNDRMMPSWTVKEQLKVWEERTRLQLKHSAPDWMRDGSGLSAGAIYKEAERRVELRMHAKMERIHRAERNMIEDRLSHVRERNRERGRER